MSRATQRALRPQPHLVGRADLQRRSRVQHADAIGQRLRLLQVVGDQQHRDVERRGAAPRSPPSAARASCGRRRRTARRAAAPCGSRASARASATRWRWPPESWSGRRASRPSRCTRASSDARAIGCARAPHGAAWRAARCRARRDAETARSPGTRGRRCAPAAADRRPSACRATSRRRRRRVPLLRPIKPGDGAQHRRLAAARRTDERQQLAWPAAQRHVERDGARLLQRDRQRRRLSAHACRSSGGAPACARWRWRRARRRAAPPTSRPPAPMRNACTLS